MAFYSPVRPPFRIHPEILLFLIALSILLLTIIITTLFQIPSRERPAINSALAANQVQIHAPAATTIKGSLRYTEPTSGAAATAQSLETAMRDLLRGPSASEKAAGIYSEVPEGTKLLGITTKGNTVTVNLSREFAGGGGATSVIQRVEEVRETVQGVNKNYKIKFAIEGKPVGVIGGLEVEEVD